MAKSKVKQSTIPRAKLSPARKSRSAKVKRPEIAVAVPPPYATQGDPLWPDDTPQVTTKTNVQEQIDSIYSRLSEADRTKLLEDVWSRFEFDTPYSRSYSQERLGVPGRFTLLREWTWPERMDVLERSHQAWERNPLAKRGVNWTTLFSVGSGGTLTYRAAEVRDVLQDFTRDPMNNFQAYEKEFCETLQVDGELWLRYFVNEQGRTVIIPLRPWHIQWITTNPENYKEILSYHYVYQIFFDQPGTSQMGIEDVPREQILHVAINRLAYELRGRPDLFNILPWLKAYKDWLEERARINRRKSVYYHVKVKNAQSGQVSTLRQQFKTPPPPGSIIVTNDNVEWVVLESNIRAGEAAEDGRQIKLMAISGMGEPEYFFADGANANLASATAQQLPVLRKFSDYQDILTDQVWMPIFARVIQNAVRSGRITGELTNPNDPDCADVWLPEIDPVGQPVMESDGVTQKLVKASEAFSYQLPELEEKDPKNLAAALTIATQNEWVSNDTASQQMGFNPGIENPKIEIERLRRQSQGAPVGTQIFSTNPAVVNKPDVSKNPMAGDSPNAQQQAKQEQQGWGNNYPPMMFDGGDRQLQPSAASPEYMGNDAE